MMYVYVYARRQQNVLVCNKSSINFLKYLSKVLVKKYWKQPLFQNSQEWSFIHFLWKGRIAIKLAVSKDPCVVKRCSIVNYDYIPYRGNFTITNKRHVPHDMAMFQVMLHKSLQHSSYYLHPALWHIRADKDFVWVERNRHKKSKTTVEKGKEVETKVSWWSDEKPYYEKT